MGKGARASLAGADQNPVSHLLPAETMCSHPAALGTLLVLCACEQGQTSVPGLLDGLKGTLALDRFHVTPPPLPIAHSPCQIYGVGITGGLGLGGEGQVCYTCAVLQNEHLLVPRKLDFSLRQPRNRISRALLQCQG